ncbi:hypothetical protein, partial [Cronobacter sakazakii]
GGQVIEKVENPGIKGKPESGLRRRIPGKKKDGACQIKQQDRGETGSHHGRLKFHKRVTLKRGV